MSFSDKIISDIQKRLDAGERVAFETPAVVMLTGSEGRRGIVRNAGLDWVLLKNNFDEEAVKTDKRLIDTVKKAAEYAEKLSRAKCESVKDYFSNAAVITADTVVFNMRNNAEGAPESAQACRHAQHFFIKKEIDAGRMPGSAQTYRCAQYLLEKPRTEAEVYGMIRGLNGSPHYVITGVTVYEGRAGKKAGTRTFSEVSEVLLSGVTDGLIAEMIATENPYACSGGYTIDGMLGPYFTVLKGTVENVIGLPLQKILDMLE